MYQRILVPLDGSKLAECALPHAEELAKIPGALEIVLVSVTESVTGKKDTAEAPKIFRDSVMQGLFGESTKTAVTFGKKERQAHKYLDKIGAALAKKGIGVGTAVLLGNPAEEIVSFAERKGLDVIVMASHGRSGPSRWTHGSVADKVFTASSVPVLMIRAEGCIPGV